ncbi:MAG: hypothetical protein EOO40_11970, partial [Deltaproteobacteria bacterium]
QPTPSVVHHGSEPAWAPWAALANHGKIIIEDGDGNRYVVIAEARLNALEAAALSRDVTPTPAAVRLTAREQGVLQLIADGHHGASAAAHLGLAVNTVTQHLVAVRRKYAVTSTAAAVALAREGGVVT